jgi:ribosomal protein L37AE/L43A
MGDMVKDTKHAGSRTKDVKAQKKEPPENCEICGQKLERDPESGEYYCPDCDFPDQ